jgi:hypothetical protein
MSSDLEAAKFLTKVTETLDAGTPDLPIGATAAAR